MFKLNYEAKPLRLSGLAPNAYVPTVVLDAPRKRFSRLSNFLTKLFGPRPTAANADPGFPDLDDCPSLG